MGLPFAVIPNNYRIPLFFAEVNNSNANTATTNQVALIIGQMTSAGSATPGMPVLCSSGSQAISLAGAGSQLARAAAAYIANDPTGTLYLLPVVDDGASVKASGSINFTEAATAPGTLYLYIGGRLTPIALSGAQTAAQIATAVAAAINAIPNCPVTAAVDGMTTSKVDLTAVNGGLIGNDVDIRVNYLGVTGGQVTPTSLAFTIVAMAGGTTNPNFATALANCGDTPFDFIVSCWNDTASLNALDTFLNDLTGRWSYVNQVYGHYVTALRGTNGALTTAGLARNGQHGSIFGFYDSPSMYDEWAAGFYGAMAVALRDDPGRPQQTLVVQGLLPPPTQSQFTSTERNTLLFSGISTFTVDTDGTIRIENCITTYQLNAFEQPDDSYLEIETLFLLMFVLRDLKTDITSKFARMKYAPTGTRLPPQSAIATDAILLAEVVARYRYLEEQGYVQDSDAFEAGAIVQQNSVNPNRADCLWDGTLINQLRLFAVLAMFQQVAAASAS